MGIESTVSSSPAEARAWLRGAGGTGADLLQALDHAEILDRQVFQLHAGIGADDCAAGEDGHVFEHGLAVVAEARGLDRGDLRGMARG